MHGKHATYASNSWGIATLLGEPSAPPPPLLASPSTIDSRLLFVSARFRGAAMAYTQKQCHVRGKTAHGPTDAKATERWHTQRVCEKHAPAPLVPPPFDSSGGAPPVAIDNRRRDGILLMSVPCCPFGGVLELQPMLTALFFVNCTTKATLRLCGHRHSSALLHTTYATDDLNHAKAHEKGLWSAAGSTAARVSGAVLTRRECNCWGDDR